MPTSCGISMVYGDPAIAVATVPGYWVAWVSSLSVSTAAWNAAGGGCLANPPAPDGACLNAVAIPADGSAATVLPQYTTCYSVGQNSLDGGSLYWSTANGNVYSAYWEVFKNQSYGRIDVYKNGAGMPAPFGLLNIFFRGHPKFVQTGAFDTTPTLIAPDTNGNFWLARWDESKNTWT